MRGRLTKRGDSPYYFALYYDAAGNRANARHVFAIAPADIIVAPEE